MAREQVEARRNFLGKLLRHQQIRNQQRQRLVRRTPLCRKHTAHGVQVHRVRDQDVKRVGGNGDYATTADLGGSTFQSLRTGLFGIDLDKVCGHVVVSVQAVFKSLISEM